MKSGAKNNLDFEVNLLPVISVLAVCISFLLLTTVWIRVGTMDVNQALGTEASSQQGAEQPKLWVTFESTGTVRLVVKKASANTTDANSMKLVEIRGRKGRAEISRVENEVARIKRQFAKIDAALILPVAGTPYDEIVTVMDQLKKNGISDLGIAPL